MPQKKYTTSNETKQALCSALKTLMAQKPLEKITIQELTDVCHMNRKSFYYHFKDIYDLVEWMFQEEALKLLQWHEGTLFWQEGLTQLLQYLEENKAVYLCAMQSSQYKLLRQFLQSDVYAIFHQVIERIYTELDIPETLLDMDLLIHFYAIAISGLIENWLRGGLDKDYTEIIKFLNILLEHHISNATQLSKTVLAKQKPH